MVRGPVRSLPHLLSAGEALRAAFCASRSPTPAQGRLWLAVPAAQAMGEGPGLSRGALPQAPRQEAKVSAALLSGRRVCIFLIPLWLARPREVRLCLLGMIR